MRHLRELKRQLKPGKVYRRADLQRWSSSVDRHLQQLVGEGVLEKLSGGIYYVPRQSVYGKVPAEDKELVKSFLKDSRFLLMSPNDYNMLGVGTTQLYNTMKVYNHKRHGAFKLGNRTFNFVQKPYFPSKVTKEFLLVDLTNNLKTLAEDQDEVLKKIKVRAKEANVNKLKKLASDFGTVGTKKLFKDVLV